MGTEYDLELEEQIENLEAENEVLGLEVDRLTEKMDGMDAALNAKHKAEYERKMSRVAQELMKDLGVTKCSTTDPEMIIAMARKKISELRWNQPTEAAPMKGMVRLVLKNTRRSRDEYSYYDYMMNRTAPWERNMDTRDESYQYYQLTVDELAKDHGNMMEAIEFLVEQHAKSMRSPNYHGQGDQRKQLMDYVCKNFNLKVLPHNKR